MTRLLLLLALPWPPAFIGAVLFASGLTLGVLVCTGGCRV
jgi:hypothetical protein